MRTMQDYELDAWLGDTEATGEQRAALKRAADEIGARWPDPDSADVRAEAFTAAAMVVLGDATDAELAAMVALVEEAMAAGAAASTWAGAAPAASSSAPTVLSGVSRSPWSRCTGSVLGLPWVRACRTAAVTASRDFVVSFSVFIRVSP